MTTLLLALALLGATVNEPGAPPPSEPAAVFAMILGVNDSPSDDLEPLQYADDDAARYTDLFQAIGARTFTLMRPDKDTRGLHRAASTSAQPPTLEHLEARLGELREAVKAAKARGASVDVFFIYSGHGVAYNGAGALTLEGGALLDGAALHRLLVAETPADHIHIILDACNSHLFERFGARGPGGRRRRITPGFSMLAPLQRATHVGLLLSTRDTRAVESYEWDRFQAGVFSHLLRSGLSGGADVNGDGLISYWEIGAFIERAGVGVLNPRFRPRVHARAPSTSPNLLSLRPAVDKQHIEVVGGGHRYLEDRDGVRLLDVHPRDGVRLRVLRPEGRDPLYLRRADERAEWALPEAPIVKVAQLSPRDPKIQSRGAAHLAFDNLFNTPFGDDSVEDFQLRVAEQTHRGGGDELGLELGVSATAQTGFAAGSAGLYGARLHLEADAAHLRWGLTAGYGRAAYSEAGFDVDLQQAEVGLRGSYLFLERALSPLIGIELAAAHVWQEGAREREVQSMRAYLLRYRALLGAEWRLEDLELGACVHAGHATFPSRGDAAVQEEVGLELSVAYPF